MYRAHVKHAWKWLLSHLVIAASISYLVTILLSGLGIMEPLTILRASTVGVRHVGGPLIDRGIALGLDKGVSIFLCNLTAALLILSIFYWVRLLNPYNKGLKFSLLRRKLQKDRTAKYLLKIPYFARIQSSQLRLTVFMLICTPYLATITIGIMAGALFGSAHLLSSSPTMALAYILPHGIPEIAGLLLACSIPVGIWMTIQPTINNESSFPAFQIIGETISSPQFQQDLKMIINLLLIAGLIEAHFTLRIVTMLFSS